MNTAYKIVTASDIGATMAEMGERCIRDEVAGAPVAHTRALISLIVDRRHSMRPCCYLSMSEEQLNALLWQMGHDALTDYCSDMPVAHTEALVNLLHDRREDLSIETYTAEVRAAGFDR